MIANEYAKYSSRAFMAPPFPGQIPLLRGIQLIPQYHRDVKGLAIEIPRN